MPIHLPARTESPGHLRCLFIWAIVIILFLSACDSASPRLEATASAAVVESSLTPDVTGRASVTRSVISPTPTPREIVELTDEDLRGTVIHFWHAWSGDSGKLVRQLVDEFNLNNRWGIVVVPVEQGSLDELYTDLDIAFTQRNQPVLVTAYLHQALGWAENGWLSDLELYVNDPIWGMSPAEQADFYPIFWDQDRLANVRLGIPAQRSGQLLYYNRTWAEELGFDSTPSNTAAFARQACAAVAAYQEDDDPANDGLGGWIISQADRPDFSAMLAWIHAFEGKVVVSVDEKPTSTRRSGEQSPYQFDTPQVKAAFTFLRGLYDDGCARFALDADPYTEFASRRGLFSTGSVMGLPGQAEAFKQAGNRDEWTVLPFPSPDGQPATSIYGPSFDILRSSPEQQLAAWVFIKWMLSPENQARLVQINGAYPLRRSVLDHLPAFMQQNPQWAASVDLLEYAHPEPPLRSWSTVRWALSDASTQLFRSYFTIDQVQNLVKLLNQTAAELHLGPDLEEVFASPVPEPTATP